MTREEREKEIVKAAEKMLDGNPNYMSTRELAFVLGAHWADEHPYWISVEDELPKKNGRYLVFNGITKDQEIFVYSNGIWWYNADRIPNMIVSHWMPLSQPPKKGDKE